MEIKLDLQKLAKEFPQFNVNDKVSTIMATHKKMVILYKGGSPVMDSPNTKGKYIIMLYHCVLLGSLTREQWPANCQKNLIQISPLRVKGNFLKISCL